MVRGVVRDVNISDIGDWDRCQHHTVSIGKDGRMINVERGPENSLFRFGSHPSSLSAPVSLPWIDTAHISVRLISRKSDRRIRHG
jgi:hypothetical protein